jgi:tetratricopeptide (TPR) repeat protein
MRFLLFCITLTGFVLPLRAQDMTLYGSRPLAVVQQEYQKAAEPEKRILLLIEITENYKLRNLDTTYVLTQKAFEQAEKIHFNRGKAWALINISFYHLIIRGKTDTALAELKKCLLLMEQARDQPGIAYAYLRLGLIYVFHYSTNLPKAIEYTQRSLQISKKTECMYLQFFALRILGVVYRELGNKTEGLQCLEQALFLAEKMKKLDLIIIGYESIGTFHRAEKNFGKALEYHKKAYQLQEMLPYVIEGRSIFRRLGFIYTELNQYDKALEYFEKVMPQNYDEPQPRHGRV